jgi:hypothetical protein
MTPQDLIDGKTGKCFDFDGIDDYVSVPDSTSLKPTDVTLSAWVDLRAVNSPARPFIVKQGHDHWGNSDGKSYGLVWIETGNKTGGVFEKDNSGQSDDVGKYDTQLGNWLYMAVTFNHTTHAGSYYVNGQLNDTITCDSSVLFYRNPWDFVIGGCNFNAGTQHIVNKFMNCKLDEIRVAKTPLPFAWIATEYNNQNDPTLFYDIGEEQMFSVPIADFIYTPEHPTNTTVVHFFDTSTDTQAAIISWYWDFGDHYFSDLQNPSHLYEVNGEYSVSLTITDSYGATDSIIKNIVVFTPVNHPPSTPIKPSGPTVGVTNRSYVYITTATDPDNDLLFYFWDWGDGTAGEWIGPYGSGLLSAASHRWARSGTYLVKVKVKDGHGLESSWSDPVSVHIFRLGPAHDVESNQIGQEQVITIPPQ